MVRRSIRTPLCTKNSAVSPEVHTHCRTQLGDVGRDCGQTSNIVQSVSYRKGIIDVVRPGQRNKSKANTSVVQQISRKKYKQKQRRQRHLANLSTPVTREVSTQPLEAASSESTSVINGSTQSLEAASSESASIINGSTQALRADSDDSSESTYSRTNLVFEEVELDTDWSNQTDFDESSYDRIHVEEAQVASLHSTQATGSDCIIC